MREAEITEIDRMAYIDGQLDDHRRLDVETALAADPPAAAALMGDLADRTALKISLVHIHVEPSARLTTLANANPRNTSRNWRRLTALASALTAAVLLGVANDPWRMMARVPRDPAYLDDAVQSREASLVRNAMASRPEISWMQPVDIRTAIRIRLPVLPQGWRLVDVQVYPSDEGPSAQLLIDTGDRGQVSLFSSRTDGDKTFQPVLVDRLGETMAFWEINGQSFVLIGDQSRTSLRAMALDLSDNRLL